MLYSNVVDLDRGEVLGYRTFSLLTLDVSYDFMEMILGIRYTLVSNTITGADVFLNQRNETRDVRMCDKRILLFEKEHIVLQKFNK